MSSWMKRKPRNDPAHATQQCVALSMRILASSCACTESTISTPTCSHAGRPAMKSSSITHCMKLSPITGAPSFQPVATRTRSAMSGSGRGVMRSTMSHGHVVFVSTQSRSALSPRRSRKSSSPERKREPLWRRLSQLSSVTGAPPRFMRARSIAAIAP